LNDLDLIPLKEKPLINLEAILSEYGKTSKKKMRVITTPDLESISKDMFSIVKAMHDALKGLKRIETTIFPTLELKQPIIP